MNPNKKTARTAGILYLLLGITGMLGILYIPSQIIVPDDAEATAANILSNELMYRIGIVCQLTCQTLFVFMVLELHKLFREVNKNLSLQMVALVIVSVPIAFLNLVNQLAALVLLGDAGFLSAIDPEVRNALVLVFFRFYENGIIVAQVFWGLWLIPFGLLVYRSVFIPRIFGILLVAAGMAYMIATFTTLVIPQYAPAVGMITSIPSMIGEFSIIFWLLIRGVRSPSKAGQLATA